MKNLLLKLICLFFLVPAVYAGGKYAGASLELGVGVRAMALGNAATAMHGESELFYHNPASLGLVKTPGFSLMYAPSFGSLKSPLANYNHIGGVVPLPGGGTVALNWTRFAVDEIPLYPELKGSSYADRNRDITLRPDGTSLGTFADVEDVVYFSFSKLVEKKMPLGWLYLDLPIEASFGMNFKMIRQRLYESKASGMGMDLGTLVRFPLGVLFDKRQLGHFSMGLSWLDASQTSVIWDNQTQDKIHRTFMLGFAYEQPFGKWGSLNLFWSQFHKYRRKNLLGAEFAIRNLSLRIGKNQAGLTAGAGVNLWKIKVDYAFVSSDFDNLNRVGCSFSF